jgi:hypothetical protein
MAKWARISVIAASQTVLEDKTTKLGVCPTLRIFARKPSEPLGAELEGRVFIPV